MDGHCQCGRINFTTPLPQPLGIYVCHCTECRHQASSAYGITCIFPAFDIPLPSPGAISVYSRPNKTGVTQGVFCTNCGSRITHRHATAQGEPNSDTIAVKGGCLDGLTKEMMRSAVHIWTRSAVVDIPEGVVAYEQSPPPSPRNSRNE